MVIFVNDPPFDFSHFLKQIYGCVIFDSEQRTLVAISRTSGYLY